MRLDQVRRTVALAAAVAILFCVVTSPDREVATAKPPHDAHVYEQSETGSLALDNTARTVDSLVTRVQTLEEDVSALQVAAIQTQDVTASLEQRMSKLTPRPAADPAPIAAPTKPTQPVTSAAVVVPTSVPTVTAAGRWTNHDGLSPREHAIQVHQFPSHLSDAQLAAMHDAWHDINGSHPPTQSGALAARLLSTDNRYRHVEVSRRVCPPGGCPDTVNRSRTVTGPGFAPVRRIASRLRR